jgi:hypothetical protein
MKLKFPEFEDIEDGTIEFAIEEAALMVQSNWTSGYNIAIMYAAAHLVSAGQAASEAMSGEATGDIASESIGRISIKYNKPSTAVTNSDATPDDFTSSSYGRRFIELRDRNFGGPVVV